MDFKQLWQDYKELILVLATATVTLLAQKILPALWKALVKLWERIAARFNPTLGQVVSAGIFIEFSAVGSVRA